ncbi:tyrosine-type recombinase/integrase [Candidatus Endoriftia persephonae]|jgi:integrase/recombinase XerC/integrase/recombinase XerD|uniref:Tyrosine recombinase XerC n=2 Tax=Gammaproteobacteria TaxID=1236 RepID=G2FJL6_9GAMM|nr:tyrosine-type recombinase/integrase [Candidatus Endoriftia persephone]EGW52997.1 tyrosine recombinase XerC [endosymbiont of Tevnia jerichonana (vent Tica)]USF88780.1 tyrosine-type recombinase/integrase [Candidatus Endoriftia persephone]
MHPTNTDLITRWLTWKEHNEGRQPGTVNKYFRYLEGLAAWLQQEHEMGLLDADRAQLEAFCGLEAHKRGLRPGSRRPTVAAVKGFYAWALKQGLLFEDPAVTVPYPKSGRRLPKGMDLVHGERLMLQPDLDTFLGVRDAAILSVFIGCGLRLSGVCRLNESDLVWAADDRGMERLIIRVREKGDHQRFVPAPHETRLLIRAYLGHEELARIDRMLPDGDQVLFVSTKDMKTPPHEYYGEARRISTRSVGEMVEKYGDQAGIPRDQCHPHALRHLYGTELTEDDVQLLKIQALMGHKDPKTTKDYVHVALRTLAKAVDQANPLSKMELPVTKLARHLSKP